MVTTARLTSCIASRGLVVAAILATAAFVSVSSAAYAEDTGGMCGNSYGDCPKFHGEGPGSAGESTSEPGGTDCGGGEG